MSFEKENRRTEAMDAPSKVVDFIINVSSLVDVYLYKYMQLICQIIILNLSFCKL